MITVAHRTSFATRKTQYEKKKIDENY